MEDASHTEILQTNVASNEASHTTL
jgi:hypothetical protein